MDDFSLERPELQGAIFSVEFGSAGRIHQLWLADPLHHDAEEFQFIAPSFAMGDELTEDYLPGTILLAARTSPDEPWISTRNQSAELLRDDDGMLWEYQFPFIDDLSARGHFRELAAPVPHLVWDIELRNRSRHSVELGELGFPMALNNTLEGSPRTDTGLSELYQDRVIVHTFTGGAASYVFAQRVNGRMPGLLIFPGEETTWEFATHVPGSLHTPYRWDGVPVVYAHSLATIEREEWGEWVNGHTNRILEPGQTCRYQVIFAAADRNHSDRYGSAGDSGPILPGLGRPHIQLLPGAIAPVDVGIGVEISGATPTEFETDVEAETETDADESGGFCFVRPPRPGPVTVSFEDTEGRSSRIHLLFTEPIADLILKRAQAIVDRQIVQDPGPLRYAILPGDLGSGRVVADVGVFQTPFGIESGLADALFLAEKNLHYPEAAEIKALDRYLGQFFERSIFNSGDGSIGSILPSADGVATGYGRPQPYPIAIALYLAMARMAEMIGGTERSALDYLLAGARAAQGLFRHVPARRLHGVGLPLMDELVELLAMLWHADERDLFGALSPPIGRRMESILARTMPFAGDSAWSPTSFADVAEVARRHGADELAERAQRLAFSARSLAPSWWSYGSDKRYWEDAFEHPTLHDHGQMCHGALSVAISRIALAHLEQDDSGVAEWELRAAFAGMMGPWSLIRHDGAASMGYSPDMASGHFGMNATSGDIGIALYQYLRYITAYVLPSRERGLLTFGCHLENAEHRGEEIFTIRPWDGIGRRIIVRQVGLEASLTFGQFLELKFGARKRIAAARVKNPSGKDMPTVMHIAGLWGQRFLVNGRELETTNHELRIELELPKRSNLTVEIEAI